MSAKLIAFVNRKGGCGKTTLCTSLAERLAQRGFKVMIADTDPQASSARWIATGDSAVETVQISGSSEQMFERLLPLTKTNDLILIDTPREEDFAVSVAVLEIADLVIIPTMPSPVDVWATIDTIERVNAAKAANPELDALIVINGHQARGRIESMVCDQLSGLDIPVSRTRIRQRVLYRESCLIGFADAMAGSRGSAARGEIDVLAEELLKRLKLTG